MGYDEFLTLEERKQMDDLMRKADERRKKKMEDDAAKHFLILDCQYTCLKHMQKKEGEQAWAVPSDCFELMQQFLKLICIFCREHGCHECHKKEELTGDEELPFG